MENNLYLLTDLTSDIEEIKIFIANGAELAMRKPRRMKHKDLAELYKIDVNRNIRRYLFNGTRKNWLTCHTFDYYITIEEIILFYSKLLEAMTKKYKISINPVDYFYHDKTIIKRIKEIFQICGSKTILTSLKHYEVQCDDPVILTNNINQYSEEIIKLINNCFENCNKNGHEVTFSKEPSFDDIMQTIEITRYYPSTFRHD